MWDAEKNLVEALLSESRKVVERVESDLDIELKRVYSENYKNKCLKLNEKHQKFQKKYDKCHLKKWNNIKNKFYQKVYRLIATLQKSWISREKKCMKRLKLLQNITDDKQHRKKKTNFTVMLLNPLLHHLKKLQKIVTLLLL